MGRGEGVSEPIDVYSDQFQIHTGPYGCTLNFFATSPQLPAPGSAPQADRVASVRMSLEHLKVMTYILWRQLTEYERQTGIQVPVPQEVLNALRIGREDWDAMWRREP